MRGDNIVEEDLILGLEDLEKEEKDAETLSPTRNMENLENIYSKANIKIDRDQFTIFELNRKHERGLIILDPDFQREEVWVPKQQSELIESVLMGIPLPFLYLNETKDGKLVVIDGRQRLTTFFKFLKNSFKLKELRILEDLNGMYFSDLDEKLQANLEDFQLFAQVIKPPTPDRVKFDIFDRVNRGGTVLNNQEMRNALYQGKSTELLKFLSQSQAFKSATSESISPKRMNDRYIILRFLSFYLWKKELLKDANGDPVQYKADLDDFLGKSMEFLNGLSAAEIEELKYKFTLTMTNNQLIFNDEAFRRPSKGGRRKPINMILFESFGYLFTHFQTEDCMKHKKIILNECYKSLDNPQLNELLTSDRGKGISIRPIFVMIDQLKGRIQSVIES